MNGIQDEDKINLPIKSAVSLDIHFSVVKFFLKHLEMQRYNCGSLAKFKMQNAFRIKLPLNII